MQEAPIIPTTEGEDDPEHFYNDMMDAPQSAEKTLAFLRYKIGFL
jgi:hypothetical protein